MIEYFQLELLLLYILLPAHELEYTTLKFYYLEKVGSNNTITKTMATKQDEPVLAEKVNDGQDYARRETVEIPDGYVPSTDEDKAMNRRINRKMDIYLLPFLSLLYLMNGLDRSNVGNAETQGMQHCPT